MEIIITLSLFIVSGNLWIMSDAITNFLSEGKSFAGNETTWK